MMKLGVFTLVIILNISIIFGKQSLTGWTKQSIDSPAKVSENVFLIFSPDTYDRVYLPLKDLQYLTGHPLFDVSRPTMMYVHGWLESGRLDLSTLAIRGAYNDRNDHNVVTVDWSEYSKNINYHTNVIPQMKVIAETFADQLRDFFNAGYNISNFHLVGHSLGGQMVGKIGRHLKKISLGKLVIPKIFALDPARPGFEDHSIDGLEPITRTDGDYVQIIHTCAGKLGMIHRVGTADFYPNGGSSNPGCDVDVTTSLIESFHNGCDHYRSWHFYQATVRNPKAFPAIRCESWDDFLNNETCYKNDIVYMGFGANTSATGKYFLQTTGNLFNLSRGMDGTRLINYTATKLSNPYSGKYSGPVPESISEAIYL